MDKDIDFFNHTFRTKSNNQWMGFMKIFSRQNTFLKITFEKYVRSPILNGEFSFFFLCVSKYINPVCSLATINMPFMVLSTSKVYTSSLPDTIEPF